MCYIVFISQSLHWRYNKTALQEYVINFLIKKIVKFYHLDLTNCTLPKEDDRNDPLHVTEGCMIMKLWPMKECRSWLKSQCTCANGISHNFNL